MSKLLAALLLVAGLLLLPARPAAAEPASAEAEFVARINALRADKGLPPLAVDGELTNVARAWSARMADAGELAHNPDLDRQVHDWQMLGENVGVGDNAAQLHQAFVNSPHHYENLVEPRFTHIGVGVVERNGQMWVTEDFKQARAARPQPAPAPPPTAAPARAQQPPRPAAVRPARAVPATPPPTAALTTTTPPPPTTTTTAPPAVAGTSFDRNGGGSPIPTGPLATGLVVGALFLASGLPLLRAARGD